MLEQNEGVTYFLVDQNLYVETPGLRRGGRLIDPESLLSMRLGSLESANFMHAPDAPAAAEPPVFKFGRMFRNPELPEFRPNEEGLIELGMDMAETTAAGDNPDLPAGYVYLGQFIDHDLSFNARTNRLPTGIGSLQDEGNLRSPSLDLDSLYGFDPATFKQTELGRKVYDDDTRLRIGNTHVDTDVSEVPVLPNDLPREGDPKKREAAAVVDPRNDENLIVAQMHLAFLKFHNAVVRKLSGTFSGQALFDEARATVVRHYQWIILCDYLPKVIQEDVLDDVVKNGCKHLVFGDDEEVTMPFEFAMAAYRFGHSLVNPSYEWNRFFQSAPHGFFAATVNDLFMFTGFGQKKLFNRRRLLSSWVIDWTRFFDFTGITGVANSPRSNRARRICPSLVSALTKLPPFVKGEAKLMAVLPVRNLLRGRYLGLPAGQCVARRLGVAELTREQLKNGTSARRREILERYGLDQLTPLWYYILKEAEELHDGKRLGPVGSRIVAETFVALMKKSKISILPKEGPGDPIWKPDLGVNAGRFSMPELLFFVHSTLENHINPLGD